MDVCLNSLLPEEKKILVVNNGAYSSRAVEICKYYGLPFIDLKFPIDERPSLEVIERTLKENEDIALVYTTHNETGTGILNTGDWGAGASVSCSICGRYNIHLCDASDQYQRR